MRIVSILGITVSKSNASDYTQTKSINKAPSNVFTFITTNNKPQDKTNNRI